MIVLRTFARKSMIMIIFIALLCITAAAAELIVGGQTVGMKVKLDGILVTSVESGSAADNAGLQSGDCLLALGGVPLENAAQLTERVESGGVLALFVRRGDETRTVFVQPNQTPNGYKLGAAVRDDLAGIGTLTYYDPKAQSFGALGHGICDLNGTTLLDIQGGVIVPSKIVKVDKSVSGAAGQLQGEFETDRIIGTISGNTPSGVFGSTSEIVGKQLQTAMPKDVKLGGASIFANIDGTAIEEFGIEIVSKLPGSSHAGKDLLIRVTDPRLLNKTGGIVQGMSGSPIIQNGKLVGAVTHVLINSPEYGYGIYIDRMLEAEERSVQPTFSFSFFLFRQQHHRFVEICR